MTRREQGAGFPHKLILLLQLAHPPTHSSDLSFHLTWIRTALTHSLAPPALECDPPAHHRFTQPLNPEPQTRSKTPYPTPKTHHHDDTPASNDDENP